jgi:predicted transcriptional regulator
MYTIQRVNGQDKILSAFEQGMVVGPRRTSLSESRTAMLLGFSRSTVSRVCQPKGHQTNSTQLREALESTWASIPVECL